MSSRTAGSCETDAAGVGWSLRPILSPRGKNQPVHLQKHTLNPQHRQISPPGSSPTRHPPPMLLQFNQEMQTHSTAEVIANKKGVGFDVFVVVLLKIKPCLSLAPGPFISSPLAFLPSTAPCTGGCVFITCNLGLKSCKDASRPQPCPTTSAQVPGPLLNYYQHSHRFPRPPCFPNISRYVLREGLKTSPATAILGCSSERSPRQRGLYFRQAIMSFCAALCVLQRVTGRLADPGCAGRLLASQLAMPSHCNPVSKGKSQHGKGQVTPANTLGMSTNISSLGEKAPGHRLHQEPARVETHRDAQIFISTPSLHKSPRSKFRHKLSSTQSSPGAWFGASWYPGQAPSGRFGLAQWVADKETPP